MSTSSKRASYWLAWVPTLIVFVIIPLVLSYIPTGEQPAWRLFFMFSLNMILAIGALCGAVYLGTKSARVHERFLRNATDRQCLILRTFFQVLALSIVLIATVIVVVPTMRALFSAHPFTEFDDTVNKITYRLRYASNNDAQSCPLVACSLYLNDGQTLEYWFPSDVRKAGRYRFVILQGTNLVLSSTPI